jgi:hypothetical protein
MTIWNKVWPTNKAPIKSEIERMYKCAYYFDSAFFKPTDLVDFGLDFHRLKEFGEVCMKKDLSKLRPHVQRLWDRMGPPQRFIFHYSYFSLGCQYLGTLLEDMEKTLGGKGGAGTKEQYILQKLSEAVRHKFPAELQDKLDQGFGKEWIQETK